MFAHWMRLENRDGEGECYQVNGAVRAVYSDGASALRALSVNGHPVDDAADYTVVLQGYHAKNAKPYLDVTGEELGAAGPSKVVASSAQTVLREWLLAHQNVCRKLEGRLVYEA